ncbi:hypothetical protein V2J09_016149 [Rumex salicifolius]
MDVILSRSVENSFAVLSLVYPIPLKYLNLNDLVKFIGFDPSSLNEPNNLLRGKSFYVDTMFKEAATFIIISFGGEVCEEWGTDRIGYEVVDFGSFDDNPEVDRVYCDPACLINFVMSKEEEITTGFLNRDDIFEDASEEFVQSLKAQAESRHDDILSWTNLWVLDKYAQQEEVLFAVQLIHFVAWCYNFDLDNRVSMKWKRLCLEWQRELIKDKVLTYSGRKDDGIDLQADVCGMHLSWAIPLFQNSDIKITYGFDCDMVESALIFYQTLKEFKTRKVEQDSQSNSLFEGDVFYLETVNNDVFDFLITAFGGEVRDSNKNEGIHFEVIDKDPVIQIPGVGRAYCNSDWIIRCIEDNNQQTPPGAYPAGRLVVPDDSEVDDGDQRKQPGMSRVDSAPAAVFLLLF